MLEYVLIHLKHLFVIKLSTSKANNPRCTSVPLHIINFSIISYTMLLFWLN